jgi:hypothetical protein
LNAHGANPLGANPQGVPFTPVIFDLFNAWANPAAHGEQEDQASRRASIARGQTLFNSKPINITGVAGLNDNLGLATIPGTCGTCHDPPNVGNHSVSAPLNIGVGDLSSPLDVSHLPVFTRRIRPRWRSRRPPIPAARYHRTVEGRRAAEGADSARTPQSRALLPQRLCQFLERRRRLLR